MQIMAGELFHSDGSRKYLTQQERTAFLQAAEQFPREVQTFCHVLTYTGCRPAEARALSADRVDLKEHCITFETLKKRRAGIFRTVPIPPDLTKMLDFAHNLRKAQRRKDRGQSVTLWTWSEATAWRKVKAVMDAAGIVGYQASPKGLRHGFGVAAVQASIPLNLVQRWLGHAQLSTTAIYAEAQGEEERHIASRMWDL
jgi:integrase/recombinase XerD